MLTLEIHGIKSDVHEDLNVLAVGALATDGERVPGRECHHNFASDRRGELTHGWDNRQTGTQLALGEHWVGHCCQLLDLTGQRGNNREGVVCSNLGGHNGCGVGAGLNCGAHIVGINAAVALCQVAAIGKGGGEGNDEGNHGADHEGAHVFGLDGHNTQEAGGTQRNGLHIQQGNQGATNSGGTDADKEGPAQPQVHAEDSGLGNAQHGGHAGGTGQALELFALGQQEHGQRCGTLGNIGHGCGGEDEGTTLLLQLQFDRRERLVQTRNNNG